MEERQKAQDELRLANEELEMRVAERTEQLLMATRELEREVEVRIKGKHELQAINHELQHTKHYLTEVSMIKQMQLEGRSNKVEAFGAILEDIKQSVADLIERSGVLHC